MNFPKKLRQITIAGASSPTREIYQDAYRIGLELGKMGFVVISGGREGVMEAVFKGVKEGGGTTVAVLPGIEFIEANPYADVVLPTGFGFARNFLIARSSPVILAIGGYLGTLSEISLAVVEGKKVIAYKAPNLEAAVGVLPPNFVRVGTVEEALEEVRKIYSSVLKA